MDDLDPKAENLAKKIAELTGEPVADVIAGALRARLGQLRGETTVPRRRLTARDILAIGRRCASLPDRDRRSIDELVGFDERGLWGR